MKIKIIFILFMIFLSACQGVKHPEQKKDILTQKNTKDSKEKKNKKSLTKKIEGGGRVRLHIDYDPDWEEIPDTKNETYGNLMISSNYFKSENEGAGKWKKYHIIGHDKIEKHAINCKQKLDMLYFTLVSDPPGEFGYTIDYKIRRFGNEGEREIDMNITRDSFTYEYMCQKQHSERAIS